MEEGEVCGYLCYNHMRCPLLWMGKGYLTNWLLLGIHNEDYIYIGKPVVNFLWSKLKKKKICLEKIATNQSWWGHSQPKAGAGLEPVLIFLNTVNTRLWCLFELLAANATMQFKEKVSAKLSKFICWSNTSASYLKIRPQVLMWPGFS